MAPTTATAVPQHYRHVMLAVDPSEASRHAAGWAADHGVPGIAGMGGLTSTAGVAEYEKELEATRKVHSTAVSDVYTDLLTRKCVTPDSCSRVLLDGDGAGGGAVADPLVSYAQAKQVDHVVVGSRGLSALKRGLYSIIGLGSVSDYIVRHAPCPVTVVPLVDHAASVPTPD